MNKKEKELELWQAWKSSGDPETLEQLLTSMEPLIRQNVNKFRAAPIPSYALESAARGMAVKAFETYDPNKSQLNTHTVNNLKHLQRFVINYQNVGRIPENRAVKISRFNGVKNLLTEKLGREPNLAELADELQWSIQETERMQNELRSDLDLREGKEESFFDFTFEEDDNLKEIAYFVWFDEDRIGKKIIEHTFGINNKPKLTTKELSEELNIPEATIRKKARDLGSKISSLRYM